MVQRDPAVTMTSFRIGTETSELRNKLTKAFIIVLIARWGKGDWTDDTDQVTMVTMIVHVTQM